MKILKLELEAVYLVIIFGILLFVSYGQVSGHQLRHETPVGYFAADAIQDEGWAQGIKESGSYKYFPAYASAGFNDTIAWYAPTLMQSSIMFSYLSGLETHDSLIFMAYFLTAISCIVMYIIIRGYSKNIALLSLPLFFILFSEKFYSMLALGQWAYAAVNMFMLAAFWVFTKIDIKKSYLLLAVFLAGIIFTHPFELVYIAAFAVLFLVIKLAAKQFKPDVLKKIIIAVIIALVISAYFILLLKLSVFSSFAGTEGGFINLKAPIVTGHYGYPDIYIKYIGLPLIIIVIGMLFSLPKIKKMGTLVFIGFFMLLVGYTNYLGGGLGDRAFQNRFFWPVYLSVFFGIGIYTIARFVVKKWKNIYGIGISIILVIILINCYHKDMAAGSMISLQEMQAFKWIEHNTPEDSRIYFFYGDAYSQTSNLWLTRRLCVLVDTNDFVGALKENTVKREYITRHVEGFLYHRTGLFESGDYYAEKGAEFFRGPMNICNFSYYVFNKKSQQPALAQYNVYIMQKMLANDWIKEVYSNGLVSVLKNEKPGDDCIGEG